MSTTTGAMRYRIRLNNPKRTSNGRGGYTVDYNAGDFMEVWAAADLLSIEQQLRYRSPDETATIRFTVRENPFIAQNKTRIHHSGAVYQVLQVAPKKENNRFWEVRAREV